MERTELEEETADILENAKKPGTACDHDGCTGNPEFAPNLRFALPETRKWMRALQRQKMDVRMVTGRPAGACRNLIGMADVPILGDNGATSLNPGESEPTLRVPASKTEADLTAFMDRFVEDLADLWIPCDRHGPSRILHGGHQHEAPALWGERQALFKRIEKEAERAGFFTRRPLGVLEVSIVDVHKRGVVPDLVQVHGWDAGFIIGDDWQDIGLAEEFRLWLPGRTLFIGVRQPNGPEEALYAAADHVVEGVPGVNDFLQLLWEVMKRRKTSRN